MVYSEFPIFVQTMLGIICILCLCGFISNVLLCRKILQNRHQSNIFTLMVCCSDGANAFLMLILNSIHFVSRRFSTGDLGCQIFGFQYQFLISISVISFLCTAADPFLIVILEKGHMQIKTSLMVAAVIISIGFMTASAPYWGSISHPYLITETELYCIACYHCRQPIAVFLALADGFAILFNPMLLFISMFLVRRRLMSSTTPKPVFSIDAQPTTSITKELQKRIAERSLILVSVQFLTYSCTATKIFYELYTGVRTPFELDMMAYLMHVVSLSVNPICFYILDGHATNNPMRRISTSIKPLSKDKQEKLCVQGKLSDTIILDRDQMSPTT